MWTYDNTDLTVTTSTGRLNTVRLLIGDTAYSDPQLEDEEINFTLSEASNNVYLAGSACCGILAAKFARDVDIVLGKGAIEESSSDLVKHYLNLRDKLRAQSQQSNSSTLGFSAVVASTSDGSSDYSFWMNQFDIEDQDESYISRC